MFNKLITSIMNQDIAFAIASRSDLQMLLQMSLTCKLFNNICFRNACCYQYPNKVYREFWSGLINFLIMQKDIFYFAVIGNIFIDDEFYETIDDARKASNCPESYRITTQFMPFTLQSRFYCIELFGITYGILSEDGYKIVLEDESLEKITNKARELLNNEYNKHKTYKIIDISKLNPYLSEYGYIIERQSHTSVVTTLSLQ